MGWEKRYDWGPYYLRERRRDGRRYRRYYGRGHAARLASGITSYRYQQERARRRAFVEEKARRAAADRAMAELTALTRVAVDATLYAAGYYLHARSHWRKRRHAR
jgi:hypothetical protein